MYSRVTLLEIDTMRIGVAEAVELFRTDVQPALSALPGYEGSTVLANPDGKGMIVSYWTTEEDAQNAVEFASGELERHVTLFKSPPGRGHYEVAFADFPHGDVRVA
jgi:heme-degrading monooxygenase HmoA